MSKLIRYFVSFDSFGEPVSINYKGDSAFKTKIGALFHIFARFHILMTDRVFKVWDGRSERHG